MKTIGLIGGISWHSTAIYYQQINEQVQQALGGVSSASLLLHSLNMEPLKQMQLNDDWGSIATWMRTAAIGLQDAGADCVLICSNTPHKVADELILHLKVPFLHIAEITADALVKQEITSVALLGTRFTMEGDFFRKRLEARGIEVLVPEKNGITAINRIIYEELALGKCLPDSRRIFQDEIQKLSERGATAVIFGCTEIGMLLSQAESSLPVFDTTHLHIQAAVEFALQDSK